MPNILKSYFVSGRGTMVDNNVFPSTHNAQTSEAKKIPLQNKLCSQRMTSLLLFFFFYIPVYLKISIQSRFSVMPSSVRTQTRKVPYP